MSDGKVSFTSYTRKHMDIVEKGVQSISEILNGSDIEEKRSILFCLDRYLDPYYGYNLPHSNDIIFLLQKSLFIEDNKLVKEDIFELLSQYSTGTLDYLADNIEALEPEFFESALRALGNTYNSKYVPIFIKYENYEIAKQKLIELSKSTLKSD